MWSLITWTERIMVSCPECESKLDLDEEEIDEGEVISCAECGTDFEVVTASPLELKAVGEGYEEDEEDDDKDEEAEDGDY
jgi:alpha-aminoadipate carrier protein LysW